MPIQRFVQTAKNKMGDEQWRRRVSPRQEITLTLIYWMAVVEDRDLEMMAVDLAKSYEHGAYRYDGLLPPHLALAWFQYATPYSKSSGDSYEVPKSDGPWNELTEDTDTDTILYSIYIILHILYTDKLRL